VETPKTPRRILIVDDDPSLNALLGDALRKAHYQVTSAESVDEAIATVGAARPDLAVLDIRMQGASGLDLGALLRDDFGVPFVFLSHLDDEATVRQATEMGAIAYLVKPLDMRQCVPAIEAALARAVEWRRLRQSESQLAVALQQGREISMAIGLLMERLRVDRETAFERLRDDARARQRRIAEVAEELLRCAERLNVLPHGPEARARRKS
jgi:AmiR/NasT family two-component response regulator